MPTAHMAIRDAVAALLEAGVALADGGIKTGRRRPMPAAVTKQVFVDLDESPATPTTMGQFVEWSTRIRVECLARDAAGAKADDAADQLLADTYGRVMANPRLSGKALDTHPAGMAWRVEEEAEAGIAACTALFTVRHRTPRASVAA